MKQLEASGNLGAAADALESAASKINEIESLLGKLAVLDMCIAEEQAPISAELTNATSTPSSPAPQAPALIQDEDVAAEGTAADNAGAGKDAAAVNDAEPTDESLDALNEGEVESVKEAQANETAPTDAAQDAAPPEVAVAPAPVASPAVIEKKPPATIDDFCCLVLERGEYNLQEYLKKAGRRLDSLKKKNILSDMFHALSAMHRSSAMEAYTVDDASHTEVDRVFQ
eukprot:gene8451-10043_t